MQPYILLGVCHPQMAYEAIAAESNIGLMLPCKILIKETGDESIEVWCIDPEEMMAAIDNEKLNIIAAQIAEHLRTVIQSLASE